MFTSLHLLVLAYNCAKAEHYAFVKTQHWKEFCSYLNQYHGINLNSLFPCNQLTATSYIYQSLGDVEWYVEMKLSAWQQ